MKISCPHCKKTFELESQTCNRCQYVWQPRKDIIKRCPRCKSPYWNRPRVFGVEIAKRIGGK